jgi:type IV secretion system protein VirB10
VIYASQIVQGMLEQAIRTGQDGTIRVRVTETLYDKFGQLEPLMPLHSLILGKVEGASVKPGQTTVPITVTKVELPDGTDLPLTGKMGSATGLSGVPGHVDNRSPEVVLTAILTAVTSIGTRSITGSPSGFQPNLGQEFTADAAQSLSRSGQKIVERSLSIDPVITIEAQTPVTIQLDKNISLQSAPVIVYR